MAAVEMESLENWSARVAPQVISCTREIVLDAIQRTAVEFFKEARVWLYSGSELVPASAISNNDQCEHDILFNEVGGKGIQLVEIESIRINGIRCCNADYTHDVISNGVRLYIKNLPTDALTLSSGFTISYEFWLRPGRYCTDIPKRLMEEYGDIISYGALAYLKMMKGEEDTIKWSDPETAKNYYDLYQKGINKAKMEAHIRRGFGMIKPCRTN